VPKKASKEDDDRRLYDPKRLIKLSDVPDFARIPTSAAAFDMYTAGGLPAGTTTLVSGPMGSGKSNFAILGMVGYQRTHPKGMALYVNANNKIDPPWAERLGADRTRIDVYRPTSTDEAHDIIYHVADKRRDMGFVLVDDLASLSPEDEIIGEQEVGISARMNNKFFRKMTMLQLHRQTIGKPLTLCVINQERVKVAVGQKFPTPIIPGGKQQEFAAALWVKFLTPDLHIDKPTGIPIAITMRYVFKKNQGGASGYPAETTIVTTPHGKWKPGQLLDHEFVWLWGRRLGVLKGLRKEPLITSWEDDAPAYATAARDVQAAFKAWYAGERPSGFFKEENIERMGESDEAQLAAS
jgi:adenosyl cobinamide kinase/adenosyl cobinamide phosphate guanylyltransferase